MSNLSNKHILVVGTKNTQIENLEEQLSARGMRVSNAACETTALDQIKKKDVGLVLINNLDESSLCSNVITTMRDADLTRTVPVFVLVDETNEDINEVLSYGAADYITPGEELESVVQKMLAFFTDTDTFSGSAAIDITPQKADVSTKGVRVFVVEDDPLLRNLLSIKLDKTSFPYEFSVNGDNVLQPMRQFNPDVIILDLMLPGKSGFEILEEVKSDPGLQDTPVIVFSNRDSQEDRAMAAQLGAAAFYVKAMTDLSELIETIESTVNK